LVAEAELERWQGVARAQDERALTDPGVETLPALVAVDQAANGADRSSLLELLVNDAVDGALVVASDAGTPEGYALARAGRMATYIGPIIATTADAGGQVINGMLGRLAGSELCLDLHVGGMLAASALADAGLSKRRILTRMRLGARDSGGTARTICASAGPEFG
jgi:hypothetical protein